MKKTIVILSLFIVAVILSFSLASCGEKTQGDNNILQTEPPEPSETLEPLGALPVYEFPERYQPWKEPFLLNFTDNLWNSKRIGDVFYVPDWFADYWEGDPLKRFEVTVCAVEWLDISASSDKGYYKLLSAYERILEDATEYAEKYFSPTSKYKDQHKESYYAEREKLPEEINALNDYVNNATTRKNSEIAEHFEKMGIECQITRDGVSAMLNKEQLLSLADTRFLLFVVLDVKPELGAYNLGEAW
ncbi:MAG: hypothetical protein IJW79_04130 [Clostridia bacterium]|nr:hypothetical protein [Clostridia bacterium]